MCNKRFFGIKYNTYIIKQEKYAIENYKVFPMTLSTSFNRNPRFTYTHLSVFYTILLEELDLGYREN
jgi:hypothetical protein